MTAHARDIPSKPTYKRRFKNAGADPGRHEPRHDAPEGIDPPQGTRCWRSCIRRPRRLRGSWRSAGCEALFVGTSGVVGGYTGMADVGTATMTECVQVAGWIASSVTTAGDHRRRHRPRRHHGGAPPGARLHPRRHRRHPHRRPADRGQAHARKAPAWKWCRSSRRSRATAPRST